MIKRIRTSVRNGERLKELAPISFVDGFNRDKRTIYVDPEREFQTHIGFGGALTHCAIENLNAMGKEKAEEVLASYFSKERGIGYSLVRHPIGSTDFGTHSYDYLPEGSTSLDGYRFDEEKDAIYYSKLIDSLGDGVIPMASTWAPPAYMKENRERNFGGKLRKECRSDWAEWIALYLENMKKAGHPIQWLNAQNEPEASQLWESLSLTAEEEGELIKNYLVPALARHGLKETKIFIWDHNKDEMVRRSSVTLADPEVDALVSGISYHWYVSDQFSNIEMAHFMHPDKIIAFSEGCVEWANVAYGEQGAGRKKEADAAEKYGRDIIEGLNRYTSAFVDWNMVVNEEGGPTWIGNFCDAPVIFDRKSGQPIHQLSYYYIGQFSKYIDRGAKRLLCMNDFAKDVYATAYKNPNGEIVVVVMNTDWLKEPVLIVGNRGVEISLPPHSITTFIISNKKGEKENER